MPPLDFGRRQCALCERDIPAAEFGRHCFGHGDDLVNWPGGLTGFINDLLASLDESIARASGHPDIQHRLRQTQKVMRALLTKEAK